MKETLQFNLHHLFTKICQIKPHSVLYQQNNCYTSTEVQSYQHHKMLFTSTSIYSHLGAEIVSKHLWFWPSEQFWYHRYLPMQRSKGKHHCLIHHSDLNKEIFKTPFRKDYHTTFKTYFLKLHEPNTQAFAVSITHILKLIIHLLS